MKEENKLSDLSFREEIIVFGGTAVCIVMIMIMIMELLYLIGV